MSHIYNSSIFMTTVPHCGSTVYEIANVFPLSQQLFNFIMKTTLTFWTSCIVKRIQQIFQPHFHLIFANCIWQNDLALFVCFLEQAVIDRNWRTLLTVESVEKTTQKRAEMQKFKPTPSLLSHLSTHVAAECFSWKF